MSKEKAEFSNKARHLAKGGEMIKSRMEGMERETEELKKQLKGERQATAQSHLEVMELNVMVQELEGQASCSDELYRLKKELVQKERMIVRVVGEKKEVLDGLDAEKDKHVAHKKAIESAKAKIQVSEDRVLELEMDQGRLRQELATMKAGLVDRSSLHKRLEAELENAQKTIVMQTAKIDEKDRLLRVREEEVASQRLALSRYEAASCVSDGKDARLEAELERIKASKTYMQTEMEARLNFLTAELSESKKRFALEVKELTDSRDVFSLELQEALKHRDAMRVETSSKESIQELQGRVKDLQAKVDTHEHGGAIMRNLLSIEMERLDMDPGSAPASPARVQELGDAEGAAECSSPRRPLGSTHRNAASHSMRPKNASMFDALKKNVEGIDGFSLIENLKGIQDLGKQGSKRRASDVMSNSVPWLALCDKLGLLHKAIQSQKQFLSDGDGTQKTFALLLAPVKKAVEAALTQDPASVTRGVQRQTVCHNSSLDTGELLSTMLWSCRELLQLLCAISVANAVGGSRVGYMSGSIPEAEPRACLRIEEIHEKESVSELKVELEASNICLEDQEKALEEIKREKFALQAKLDAVTQHYQAIVGKLAAVEADQLEANTLREIVDAAQRKLKGVTMEYEQARKTIAVLQQEAELVEMQQLAMNKKFQGKEAECNRFLEEVKSLKEEASQLRQTMQTDFDTTQQGLLVRSKEAQESLQKELQDTKAQVAKEKTKCISVEKELAGVQKAFTEAQECLQSKLSKLQQAFADENKLLRQKLTDETAKAEEADAVNESTSSNEAQELEVHYTRHMAAQQFEFSKERDRTAAALEELKKQNGKLTSERDKLLDNMHSLATDVTHLEEQLARAEEDLRQALHYIQDNDKSVRNTAGSDALRVELKAALKQRDEALTDAKKYMNKLEACQAEHEIEIQQLEEELSVYENAALAELDRAHADDRSDFWRQAKQRDDDGRVKHQHKIEQQAKVPAFPKVVSLKQVNLHHEPNSPGPRVVDTSMPGNYAQVA